MNGCRKGITRRKFLAGSLTLADLGLFSGCQRDDEPGYTVQEQTEGAATENSRTRLIFWASTENRAADPTRSSPVQVILTNGVSYMVNCGFGVAHITRGSNLRTPHPSSTNKHQ